jgi:hypothetical protein
MITRESSGGLLWTLQWTLEFHKREGILWLGERLSASHEGLCSMELVDICGLYRTIGVKVKVKLSLCLTKHHAMKAYWESGGIAPRILHLGTRWRWVVSFVPQPFYRRYPSNRRLGGSQSRSGHDVDEKNSQPQPGLEPPTIQPVAQRYTTELSRLSTEGCKFLYNNWT